MTVMEKTRDVGMLRTLGASRRHVMGIFMIKGSAIGMLGTLAGTALGLYICWLLSTNMAQRQEIIHAVPLIGSWLLSTNIIQHSLLYAITVIGILSLCQVGITFKKIDIVGTVRSVFVLTASVLVIIAGNFVIIAGIFVLKDGMDWLVSFGTWLVSFMTRLLPLVLPFWLLAIVSVLLLIGVISLLIFWIFVMIKSWYNLPPKWKTIFFPSWLLAIGFVIFCLVEPISLKELGLSAIYQMNQLPIKVNWLFVVLMNVLSFEICWLATIYPAWQASNLKPIEALQYE
jgi:ABC-type antimicrobial peptide transport system permease subunit